MNNLISIIIVNYNGKMWLQKLFDSLLSQTYQDFEIIFVDNASSDDSLEFLNINYNNEKIKIIKSDKNLGFAGGNNLGIEEAKGKYILLLNSDTWLDKNFLEKIKDYFLNNNFDILSPIEVDYESKKLDYADLRTIDFFGHPYFKKENWKNFYLQGVCLFFEKELYIKTKGLDDNFFMYFEETDWFWRLNLLQKKYETVQSIQVNHYGSGSAGTGLKYSTFLWRNQNTLQMLLKNYQWFNLLWILPIYFLQNIFEVIFFLFILKPKIAFSYLKGWIFVAKNLNEILKKRKWVQENRIISDYHIMKKMYIGFAKLDHLLFFYKLKK